MIEIRFHGRGGQGVVVASNILGEAAFREGKFIQSFPFFGVERRGAPVTSFLRLSDAKINIRTHIYNPDYVVVMDPTLLKYVDILSGIKKQGIVLINTKKNPSELKFPLSLKVYTVAATDIADEFNLGSKTSPIVNTAMLGAFTKITNLVKLENLLDSINFLINVKRAENIEAAKRAYKDVKK